MGAEELGSGGAWEKGCRKVEARSRMDLIASLFLLPSSHAPRLPCPRFPAVRHGCAEWVILDPMDKQILYVGDTSLSGAAGYLAGVMTYDKLSYDYVASDARCGPEFLERGYRAVIISDYPSANLEGKTLERLAERIQAGMGLLMIGGWESFHGAAGEYAQTVLKEVLPVVMLTSDDRVNCAQPCLVEKCQEHPIVAVLPFDDVCSGIGGYNRVTAKPGGLEVLRAQRFKVRRGSQGFVFSPMAKAEPLLVVGSFGKGRVTAFTSDVAPHWVGGLVDWGDRRVTACAQGANTVEVGDCYARFFSQMVRWTANL